MKYLLDSDVVIDYVRDYEPTIEAVKSLAQESDDLYVSVVTNFELHVGKSITQEEARQKIDRLFAQLVPMDVSFEIAGRAGDFRRQYGTSIADALIAATAYTLDAVVVTKNLKHFRPIKEIKVRSVSSSS